MDMSKFTKLFLKEHFKQTYGAYFLLFICICFIIYAAQFNNLTGFQGIIQALSLSYIAAFIFYYFINLWPEYINQKQSLITIENELYNISVNICHILGIIKSFSGEDYANINLPNYPVHVIERNFRWKDYFCPRKELIMYINNLQNELNNIKIKYCVLPVNLICTLHKIENLDLAKKIENICFCLDKGYYDIISQQSPECYIELEKAINEIEKFGIKSIRINLFDVLTEHEKTENIEELSDIKTCKD